MKPFLLSAFLLLTACQQTPEEIWLDKQTTRCAAMGGFIFYDKASHLTECFRHPIGRMTKTLFSEKFE